VGGYYSAQRIAESCKLNAKHNYSIRLPCKTAVTSKTKFPDQGFHTLEHEHNRQADATERITEGVFADGNKLISV